MASVERRPGAETAERRPAQVIKQFPEFAKNLLANLPAEMRREQDDLKASAAPDAPPRRRPLALAATDGRAGVRVRDRSWGRAEIQSTGRLLLLTALRPGPSRRPTEGSDSVAGEEQDPAAGYLDGDSDSYGDRPFRPGKARRRPESGPRSQRRTRGWG